MLEAFENLVAAVQGWLFEAFVQPVLYAVGAMTHADAAYDATEWFVLGVFEVTVLALILVPLERRFGVEPMVDRQARRVDVIYTLLHRLGGFALLMFAVLTPLMDALEAELRLLGMSPFHIEQLWPGFTDRALVAFLMYLVVLDLADYWMHRAQHRWRWWWALHALHHSQRQMTFWSDQRNHLLDDLLRDVVLAALALAIGAAPAQFVLLTIATRVLQSLQHANLRLRFGPFERLLVSPSYHRRHHGIGTGHEGPAHGCNFAVLFPLWDVLFGTADFRPGWVATGVRDQLDGRDYGRGFWAQQWLGIRRLFVTEA